MGVLIQLRRGFTADKPRPLPWRQLPSAAKYYFEPSQPRRIDDELVAHTLCRVGASR